MCRLQRNYYTILLLWWNKWLGGGGGGIPGTFRWLGTASDLRGLFDVGEHCLLLLL
jgi:hypothetical protein